MSLSSRSRLAAPPPPPPLAHRILRSRGLVGLLVVCAGAWLLLQMIAAFGGPEAVRTRFGLGAAVLLVPVQAVVAVSPFPSEVIALAEGAIYGFAIGWALAWAGWCLGAALEYFLYRRIAGELGGGSRERLPAWLRRFPVQHPVFLVLGRLVPFGNHAVNALAGSCGVPFGRFAWASAVAFLPFSALIAAIASGLVKW
jgi:uncharacterized membrane protein YdjX (TVP38/TMEM64 family)